MSKAKAGSSKEEPKEFPIPLVEEYGYNCERLKKYESAVIKRFAPKLQDILKEFFRLTYAFNESFLPEYAALAFMGAARCEKIQERHEVERHYLINAAEAFLKAYYRRFELGYNDPEDEYRQGALRCYDEILQNPNLPKDSFIRAMVIRQLKTIDPHTEQTSTFESPLLRYEDLKRAAIVDINDEYYQNALNKLTDISDDIIERKKEAYHHDVLEYSEITRLLLLLHLELPPAALAPSNAALLERYRLNLEVCPSARAKESSLDPELFLMFRALVQGIQVHNLEFIRDAFNDLAGMEFLTPEQHKLLRLAFYKYKFEFEVEEAEKNCKCLKSREESDKGDVVPCPVKHWDDQEPLDKESQELADDLERLERECRMRYWPGRDRKVSESSSEEEFYEEEKPITPKTAPKKEEESLTVVQTDQIEKLTIVDSDNQNWVDPLSQALKTSDDEEEGAVGGNS